MIPMTPMARNDNASFQSGGAKNRQMKTTIILNTCSCMITQFHMVVSHTYEIKSPTFTRTYLYPNINGTHIPHIHRIQNRGKAVNWFRMGCSPGQWTIPAAYVNKPYITLPFRHLVFFQNMWLQRGRNTMVSVFPTMLIKHATRGLDY